MCAGAEACVACACDDVTRQHQADLSPGGSGGGIALTNEYHELLGLDPPTSPATLPPTTGAFNTKFGLLPGTTNEGRCVVCEMLHLVCEMQEGRGGCWLELRSRAVGWSVSVIASSSSLSTKRLVVCHLTFVGHPHPCLRLHVSVAFRTSFRPALRVLFPMVLQACLFQISRSRKLLIFSHSNNFHFFFQVRLQRDCRRG